MPGCWEYGTHSGTVDTGFVLILFGTCPRRGVYATRIKPYWKGVALITTLTCNFPLINAKLSILRLTAGLARNKSQGALVCLTPTKSDVVQLNVSITTGRCKNVDKSTSAVLSTSATGFMESAAKVISPVVSSVKTTVVIGVASLGATSSSPCKWRRVSILSERALLCSLGGGVLSVTPSTT